MEEQDIKQKRATFGAMKDRVEIVGDILEPTSELVSWEVMD